MQCQRWSWQQGWQTGFHQAWASAWQSAWQRGYEQGRHSKGTGKPVLLFDLFGTLVCAVDGAYKLRVGVEHLHELSVRSCRIRRVLCVSPQ